MLTLQSSFQSNEDISMVLRLDSLERQELADRSLRGLMLIKRKLGTPKWVLKYQCPRTLQKRSVPIGGYPEVSLHEARQLGMQIIRQEYGSDQFELIQHPVTGSEASMALTAQEVSGLSGLSGLSVGSRGSRGSKHLLESEAGEANQVGNIVGSDVGNALGRATGTGTGWGMDGPYAGSGLGSNSGPETGSDVSAVIGSSFSSDGGSARDKTLAPLAPQALGPMNPIDMTGGTSKESSGVAESLSPRDLQAGVLTPEQQSAKKAIASVPTPVGSGRIKAFITLTQFHLDHYLPYIKVAKRSWGTDVSVLKNHILPMLGGYAMLDLKPFVIQEMVQALVKKGLSPSTCNRALIILRFMYNCGLKWEVLPKMENPCKNVKELALNNKKERFLNGNEISTLKLELAKSKNKFLPYIVQLLILTGCRRGEALNAQIQHFDLGRGDWRVPLPKAGKARHIPLNELAIKTIRAAIVMKQSYNQVAKESHFLFPNPATGEPFQQIFYSWDKARKAAHINTVRMHDLRHSFASAMVNSGMTLYDVKEILGHSNIRTTERYAHLSNSRLRQAAGAVSTFYENQDWIGDEPELIPEN